jgi:hypothetical protein
MAFTVHYGKSVRIECETLDEAIALAHRLENGVAGGEVMESAGARRDPVGGGDLGESRFREFAKSLNQSARKLLQTLADNPHGKTDQTLIQTLGLDGGKELGGVLSGISKRARNAGISKGEIYTLDKKRVGDEDFKEFRLTPRYLKLIQEIGLK